MGGISTYSTPIESTSEEIVAFITLLHFLGRRRLPTTKSSIIGLGPVCLPPIHPLAVEGRRDEASADARRSGFNRPRTFQRYHDAKKDRAANEAPFSLCLLIEVSHVRATHHRLEANPRR